MKPLAILPAFAAAMLVAAAPAVAAVSCPASLGGRAFSHLDLMVGSPDGRLGTIAQNGSEFDKSGRRGRDLFPLAGERDVFLRCHYDGGRVTVTRLPPGIGLCAVDYHYVDDYATRADRIFCR
ncbi:MAG TPA: STY0301 family protein [Stellaceae bacterium]|nr:STY0301 family protein [Stellaceae bacterium]